MRKKSLFFIIAVAVVAVLLLAGCRSGCDPNKATTLDCFVPRNDGGTKDSLREYYERMERWEMLHGGMSRWESDK